MDWEAVCFDLDNTLYSHESAFKKAIYHCFDKLFENNKNHTLTSDVVFPVFKKNCDKYWSDYEKGYLSAKDYRRKRFLVTMKQFNLNYTVVVADEFQRHYYDIVAEFSELFPFVPELLTELKKKGVTLAIITNGSTTTQVDKIKKMKLNDWFKPDNLFISEKCTCSKPEREIFDLAKKVIRKKSLLYIGDSWEQDVVGAIEAGWEAIYLNTRLQKPTSKHKPLKTCYSIHELYNYFHFNSINSVCFRT